MLRSVRKEIAATKLGTQARHNAYHGNANVSNSSSHTNFRTKSLTDGPQPGKQLDLPIVQKRRRISYASDDETPSLVRKRKKSHEDIGSKILLSKRQLLAEEANCHYCQLASFSIYEGYPVTVENNVDDSTFPPNFRFIEKQILGKGVERVDPGFHSGCECSNGYCESGNCQCHNPFDDEESEHSNGSIPNRQLPYVMTGVKKGCLRTNLLNSRDVLWECHEACQCGPKCPNRIVANGRQIPLTIFRTADRGWGKSNSSFIRDALFLRRPIPCYYAVSCILFFGQILICILGVKSTVDVRSGQFIDCYFGEILTLETANKRRDSLDRSNNKDIYLFGLDKFYDEKSEVPAENTLYEVDGALFGGPTRFINHSCKPNLRIFARVGSVVEKNLHDLAFFAIRDIKAGDELLFDYVDGKENSEIFDGKTKEEIAEITKTMTKCLCGSRDECRKFLWG